MDDSTVQTHPQRDRITSRRLRELAAFTVIGGLPLYATCSDSYYAPDGLWSQSDNIERVFCQTTFEAEWTIGNSTDDTTFFNPWWLAAGPEGVAVWDGGKNAVIRISSTGGVSWSFGRQGDGPGEFRSVRDIVQLSDGRVAVVDDINERLTVIDQYGETAESIDLSGIVSPSALAALPDGGYVIYSDLVASSELATPSFVSLRDDGTIVDSLQFPWERYHSLASLQVQGRIVGVQDGWVFGLTHGNGWWHFGTSSAPRAFPYAEHVDFIAVSSSVRRSVESGRLRITRSIRPIGPTVRSAIGLGAHGDTLFVHYGGGSPQSRALVDVYSLIDGAYRGTMRLPGYARAVAFGGDHVYALHGSTHPMLTALRRPKGEGDCWVRR